jgi:UDP-glucose 4-epimerase
VRLEAVLHFAARSLVGESVAYPDRYWSANLGGSVALLEAMREAGVRRIVFSSTAAVYGDPASVPIRETAPALPANPYGATKVAVDTVLTEYARMYGMAAVSLRYFNVAGAYQAPGGQWLGERHSPETHLIPNVLAVAQRGDGPLRIFGDDYPTPDGTCVRDYIHVADLAQAHLLALGACAPGEHKIYNLGSGTGFSNREILAACQDVTGLTSRRAGRRPGDPAILVARPTDPPMGAGPRPARSWPTRGRSLRRLARTGLGPGRSGRARQVGVHGHASAATRGISGTGGPRRSPDLASAAASRNRVSGA